MPALTGYFAGTFFARHWRGEYSLPVSFWVVGVGGTLLFIAVVAGLVATLRLEAFNPYLVMGVLTFVWIVGAGCQLFQAVGVWRAARRSRREARAAKGRGLWAYAAQAVVLLVAILIAGGLAKGGVPQLREAWRMAFLGDPAIPDYGLRLMRDGTELEVYGGFKYGLARDATRLVAKAPNLKVVHLNSGGGRLGEAIKLARLIHERGLDTYTSASCNSACVIAFLAGRQRWLKANAQLGFHRESFAGIESSDSMRQLLSEAGLEPGFVDRAVAPASTSMWYPTIPELTSAKLITGTVSSYRFAASGYGLQPDLDAFAVELRRTPLFAAIEQVAPQVFDDIVGRFQRLYQQGETEGLILDRLRNDKIAPLIVARLARADDALLAEYAALMADQYAALGKVDGAACYRYAAMGADDSALVNLLPLPLRQREMALSERVLRANHSRPPVSDADALEIYRAISARLVTEFGAQQVQLLSDPAKVQPEQYGLYCRLAVAMFRAISQLPPRQAGDAMNHIFRTIGAAK